MRSLLGFLGLGLVLAVILVSGLEPRARSLAPRPDDGLSQILDAVGEVRLWQLDPLAIVTEPVLTAKRWPKTLRQTFSGPVGQALAALARKPVAAADANAPVAACPFAPTLGLEFIGGSGSAWWLVAPAGHCAGRLAEGALVTPDADVRKATTTRLSDRTQDELETLLGMRIGDDGGE